MNQDLIIVKQLPIIEERLKSIKEEIQTRTQEALSLACTEETVKEIKKVRAELSKSFKELESQRKAVKSKVLSPYEQFEVIYKACVTDIYAPADAELKSRIDEVENAVKDEKRSEVSAYFTEYATTKGIDFLTFDRANISVGLSSSVKALKQDAAAFIDKVLEELALIDTQEHKEEVLVEYKKSLNVANAITSVKQRHEQIEAERKRQEEIRIQRELREATAKNVQSAADEQADSYLAPPSTSYEIDDTSDSSGSEITPDEAEKVFSATFTVRGTIEQLKALKEFLVSGGYKYESVK